MKPQLPPNAEKGRYGENYVRNVVENGWRAIFVEIKGDEDRGFDGVVFDIHCGELTSFQFNVQIKTSKFGKNYPGDTFPAPVEKKHLLLWRESNVPVVLICVDEGPPTRAYWTIIRPDEVNKGIKMCKRNVFGPESRDNVITAVKEFFPSNYSSKVGDILPVPLNSGIRKYAKYYYYRKLLGKPQEHPVFGPIEFTWKGWRHITRGGRSTKNIANSLLLLPCVRSVLESEIFPAKWRPLKSIKHGNRTQYRTLLVFYRVITFPKRAPAWIKVVVERQVFIPEDWISSPPNDNRREISYKFLSVYEMSRPVDLDDLS